MINSVTLVGRMVKDPELRKTSTGISTVGFTLACNRKIANAQGGHDADFINCVAWRQTADYIKNYVKKGNLLGIEGRIQTRNYKDQDDRTVYVTEVVCDSVQFLEPRKDTETPKQETKINPRTVVEESPYGDFGSNTIDIGSDDLPF